jgi:hypothetical protein
MADHADKVWDEYDWERFLQQQEQRTEKYMELLEKYLDHPQRDEIIAQEMGWSQFGHGEARDWEEEMEAKFEQEMSDIEQIAEDDDAEGEEDADGDAHPLYRETLAFALELDDIFFDMPSNVQEHPATVTLQNQTSLAATKLAAALNDDDIDELGMRIAYLKRALHAINASLDAVSHLRDGNLIGAAEHERVRGSLFSIRDGVVSAMGEYRAEFRKRHGR